MPNASNILRWVSIRHGRPFSIREMVSGDTFASRANSALLINSDSRICLSEFLRPIYFLHLKGFNLRNKFSCLPLIFLPHILIKSSKLYGDYV